MNLCAVSNCLYIADSFIEDFPVCALHNAHQTRKILERLEAPAAYWMHDRPIVMPCGDLTEEDFVTFGAPEGAMHAWEDQRLANVPTTPHRQIHPDFDLTGER